MAYPSSIQSLVLVAQHHGIDVTAGRLMHEYALDEAPPDRLRLRRIATDLGLKSRLIKMDWDRIINLGLAYPAIAFLNDGSAVIVSGYKSAEGEKVQPELSKVIKARRYVTALLEKSKKLISSNLPKSLQQSGTTETISVSAPTKGQVVIVNPASTQGGFSFLEREEFESMWDGTVLLLKRVYALNDEKQPFGLRWFIPEILRQKKSFRDVALAALFIHFIALATPIFFQVIIDKVLVHQSYSTLNVLGIGIVAALLFEAVLEWLRNFLLLYATSKIDIRVATKTFSHLLSLSIPFFEKATAGTLTKHMQQADSIRQFLTGSLLSTLLDASALLVFIPVLFFYSVKLTLVVLVISFLICFIILVLIPTFRRRLQALYQAEAQRQSMLVESIQGMRTVKALALEPAHRQAWDNKASHAVTMHFRVGKISISARTLSKLLEKLMTVAIIWVGAHLVFAGDISVGVLVAFNMLATRVSGPLVQLVGLIHEYQETALSVRMLASVMNQPSEMAHNFGGVRPAFSGQACFENVDFRYAPNLPLALDKISLEIAPGSTVGVVGRSGSGKTTLTYLLQGIHLPQNGLIRFDGIDIRELDLTHLRQQVSVVLQENFLFRGTVKDNIRMSRRQATSAEIIHAAQLAGANEFIERLPQGFDTFLEENASNLSGGQKQRLAIARALLTQPRILILDEATSALDPESEAILQTNLQKIAKDRTLFIVSHRLAMLSSADCIVVLDSGKIIGKGTHNELLKTCSVYNSLWNQQMRGYNQRA